MAIGQQQTLSFTGSAVHGGGSCQVSLTQDNPATKNSKWQVIHSIEGGCPAKGQAGNLQGQGGVELPPTTSDPDKYTYSIPQGINPGKYTLAWTWFNKVGNREMYMNCANIQVTGGSSKRDTPTNETNQYAIRELSERASTTFPDMFVANIPTSDCTTPETSSIAFPNPGSSVEKNEQTLGSPSGPKCGGGSGSSAGASSGGAASGGASSGSSSGSAASPASPSGSAAAAPASSGSASAGSSSGSSSGSSGASSGGVDSQAAPGAASSPSSPSAAAPSTAAAAPAPAPAQGGNSSGSSSGSAAPAAAGSSSGSSGSSSGGSSSGASSGGMTCSPDGKQFSLGNGVFQPVALGTKCANGAIAMAKRSAKYNKSYVRSVLDALSED